MVNIKKFKVSHSSIYNKILESILWLHVIMWLFYLPIAQLQMQLFGRRILTLLNFGLIEGFFLLLLFSFKASRIKIDNISRGSIYLIGMLLFIELTGLFVNFDVALYWRLYYIIYWVVPLVVIVAANQTKLALNRFLKALLFIIVIHAILILVQRFTNSILWPFNVDENGDNFFYISEDYYNTNSIMARCPGISASGLDAGVLLVFGINITWAIPKIKKLIKYLLTILFIIAIWFTGTRNVYILLFFIIAFVFICNKIGKKKKRKIACSLLVIFSVAAYAWIFNYLGVTSPKATANVLTDTLSAKLRLINWGNVLAIIGEGNIFQLLLGKNIWQSAGTNLLIDNMYLEFTLMGGIICLVGFCRYFVFLADQLVDRGDKNIYPLAAFVAGVFLYGVANVFGNIYMTLIIITVIIVRNKEQLME